MRVDRLSESLTISERTELGVRVTSTDERLVGPAEDGRTEAVAGGRRQVLVVSEHLVELRLEEASDGLIVQSGHVLSSISDTETSDGPGGVGATVVSTIDPELRNERISTDHQLHILGPETLLELEDDLYSTNRIE